MSKIPVLIVGSGPAGLTLACDLVRRGIEPRLIERLPELPHGSKGKGLQPRTLEVFDDLGLVDAVLAAGRTYPKIRLYKGGQVVDERPIYAIEPASAAVPYPNTMMLPQWKTAALLRERLVALGGRVDFATTLADFTQDDDGVTATLEEADGTRTVRAQYLVGTDGGRSTVRQLAGLALEGATPSIEGLLVADVLVDGLDRDVWHYWVADEDAAVGLCPLPATQAFQLTAMVGPEARPELNLDALQAIITRKSRRNDLRLHGLSWISLFRPNVRMAQRLRAGRIFIAGDAAHVHPPAGGQGLNTSVQDAYNLGWKLAAVLNGAASSLLDSYQEERLPVAAGVLVHSHSLYRGEVEGEQAGLQRGHNEKQLRLSYRGGSLFAGECAGSLQPGDRMPDLRLNDDTGETLRLFDLMRGSHATLLVLSAPWFSERPGLRVVEVGVGAFEDIDNALAGGSAYLVIRPDGYIGAITSDAALVERYLDRILPPGAVTAASADIVGCDLAREI